MVCNDHHEFAEAVLVARANRRRRGRAATGPAQDWREDLEAIIHEGWTGHGQTNKLLKEIATYGRVFERLNGHELKRYIEKVAIEAPGFYQYCNHQHEIVRRCEAWGNAVEKYYWPLGDEPLRKRKPFKDICQQRANDARDRIAEAVKWCRFELRTNIKHRVATLTAWAKCSAQTLYKNCDLWHPEGEKRSQRVTPSSASDAAELESVQRLCRESLESVGIRSVTHERGENEVCILKSSDLKNLSPEGKGGGSGGGKGLSTGWLPDMNWQEGAVNASEPD